MKMNWFSQGNSSQNRENIDKFSVRKLQELYDTLVKNQEIVAANQDVLVETVREIAEVIVYGDQHTEQLFDYFCEKNMLPLLVGFLDQPNCNAKLQVQIIQSVSIIVQNIRSEISLYYTFSNNHVNRLIAHDFNFENEEILGHFISFLKTLSLKLNRNTIQFFFNDRLNTFPLYEEAIKFYAHPESMVRTAVRTITLNIYRVKDDSMIEFLVHGPSSSYMENLIRFVHSRTRRLFMLLHRATLLSTPSRNTRGLPQSNSALEKQLDSVILKMDVALTEEQDHLLYMQDILDLGVPGLADIIVDTSMAYYYLPLLIASLLPQTFPFCEIDDMSDKTLAEIGLKRGPMEDQFGNGALLSLFLLAQSGYCINNTKILNRILESVLLPTKRNSVENLIKGMGYEYLQNMQGLEITESCPESEDTTEAALDQESGEDTDSASSLLQREAEDGSMEEERRSSNPVREAFFHFLREGDDRHCLGTVCFMHAMIENKNVDPELLKSCGLRQCENETYPEDLVCILLQRLCNDVAMTTVSLRAISKLLMVLLKPGDEYVPLIDEHRQMFNDIYALYVNRLKAHIDVDVAKKRQNHFIDRFEDQWEDLCRGPLRLDEVVSAASYLVYSTTNSNARSLIPLDARRPATLHEDCASAIKAFLIIKLMRVALDGQDPELDGLGTQFQLNKTLEVRQHDAMRVTVMTPSGHNNIMQPAMLVLAQGCLILVEPELPNSNKGTTKSVIPLHRADFVEGYNDPLVMHISIRSRSPIGWCARELPPLTMDTTADHSVVKSTSMPWTAKTRSESKNRWYLTIRFDNHGSAYWAREQLHKAIVAATNAKWTRVKNIVLS